MSDSKSKMRFKTAYSDHDVKKLFFEGPGRTKQSFRDECDINTILRKYVKSGFLSHVRDNPGQYGDFSDVDDYHTALNKICEANEGFLTLPSELRSRFSNDPSELIAFLANPDNRDEAIALGLIEVKKMPPESAVSAAPEEAVSVDSVGPKI